MSPWKIHPDTNYYFCTTSITKMYPAFVNPQYCEVITKSLSYCRINKGLELHAYVIMPNHLHLIVSAGTAKAISAIFRDFKRHTSSEISELLQRENREAELHIFRKAAKEIRNEQKYKIWRRGFHPIALTSAPFFAQKFKHLHNNPVQKRYVRRAEHWVYSSAQNYAGLADVPLDIEKLTYAWLH